MKPFRHFGTAALGLVLVGSAACSSRPPPPSGPAPAYERPIVKPWGAPSASAEPGGDDAPLPDDDGLGDEQSAPVASGAVPASSGGAAPASSGSAAPVSSARRLNAPR